MILYELLTGERPFRGEVRMLIVQILQDDPPSPRRLNRGIPRDLETIALKCLDKEASRRYQTAQALADDLTHWLKGEPITARPVTWIERGWRWCKRKPTLAVLFSLLALLVLLFGVGGPLIAVRQSELRVLALVEAQRARLAEIKTKTLLLELDDAIEREQELRSRLNELLRPKDTMMGGYDPNPPEIVEQQQQVQRATQKVRRIRRRIGGR